MEALLLELDSKPNLVTFLYPDGTREYFDNSESFYAEKERVFALNAEKEKWVAVSNPPISVYGMMDDFNHGNNHEYAANLFLHDDRNYEDTKVEFDLKKNEDKIEIAHLKKYGMNDKTTSFCAYSLDNTSNLFELYEDNNWHNHCFSFLVTKNTYIGLNQGEMSLANDSPTQGGLLNGKFCCPNLKNIHVKGTKHSSWNDRITSIRITRQ